MKKTMLVSDKSTLAPGLRMLPKDTRADVYLLYGVLRSLDDLVDNDQPQAMRRVDAVQHWARNEYADTPETRTLTELSRRHTLPAQAFLEFCLGMQHDIARTAICTEGDLELYCQRAGGSVGIMLAHLLKARDHEDKKKMATLGRAMQRTNILRDIDEDATHGRVYIASSTINHFGLPRPGMREKLLRDQIARADALYDQAIGPTSLAAPNQRGMELCAVLYREILRQIERDGYGRTAGAVVVPAWRRHMLIVKHRLRLNGRHPTLSSDRIWTRAGATVAEAAATSPGGPGGSPGGAPGGSSGGTTPGGSPAGSPAASSGESGGSCE